MFTVLISLLEYHLGLLKGYIFPGTPLSRLRGSQVVDLSRRLKPLKGSSNYVVIAYFWRDASSWISTQAFHLACQKMMKANRLPNILITENLQD